MLFRSFTSAVSWVFGTEGAATSAPIDNPSAVGASPTTGGAAGVSVPVAGGGVVASCARAVLANGIAASDRPKDNTKARLKSVIDITVTFLVVRRPTYHAKSVKSGAKKGRGAANW